MTHSRVIPLDDATFDSEVLRTASPLPVLVDFTAAWCGPCKALRPIVERLAETQEGRLRVAQVDIDDSPEIARRLGIRGAPTVVVFKGGKEIARHLGATSRARLLELCGVD